MKSSKTTGKSEKAPIQTGRRGMEGRAKGSQLPINTNQPKFPEKPTSPKSEK